MRWFGDEPFAPVCHVTPRAERPIGAPCYWCDDPIGPDETGFLIPHCGQDERPIHDFCQLRTLIGGVNHLKGLCMCCGGDRPPDPPDMTLREAAHAAVRHWRAYN